MARQKVISAADAARLIPDGAIVTVSSSSALGCPDAVLAAIGARFDAEGHPRNLTTLHPIAAGDMWGVKGIDHLAKPGCLARVLAGSYPSGPSSAEPPEIWQMISRQRDPRLQRALGHPVRHASRGGGQAARRADQDRHGHVRRSRPRGLRDERQGRAPSRSCRASDFAGDDWLFFPTIVPRRRDHPRHHRRRARQSLLRARGRHSRPARSGASRAQQRRPRHRAGQAARRGRHAAAARRRRARRARRRHRRRARPDADDATRPTIPRSRARSSGRCRRSRRRSSTSPR